MISPELQDAIDNLHIHDVYVRDLLARCVDDFDPKYDSIIETLAIQFKYVVKQSVIVELENQTNLLRVFVEVGARWIDEAAEDEASSIKAFIEAEFIAEYTMDKGLEQKSIDEFSLKNVSYHTWPYWRELLSSQCTRMHLPRVILPTVQLAHNRRHANQDNGSGQKEKNKLN